MFSNTVKLMFMSYTHTILYTVLIYCVITVVMDEVSLGQARIVYKSPMIMKDGPSP
uniref:Uncharacterized protein n=1 Tax=Amphimedon queenslandica TaxID=400682 RepID=A0A1X7UK68_AMPQE